MGLQKVVHDRVIQQHLGLVWPTVEIGEKRNDLAWDEPETQYHQGRSGSVELLLKIKKKMSNYIDIIVLHVKSEFIVVKAYNKDSF